MGISCMVLGQSGRGKSRSLKFLEPSDTVLIKVTNKPLPFKNSGFKKVTEENPDGNLLVIDDKDTIISVIRKAKSKGYNKVVIDDFQYVFANEFFRRSDEKGFDKFTEIGKAYWEILNIINDETDDDLRVYILTHIEETEAGVQKMKTIGKLVDEKLTAEGMCTVVLKANFVGGKYYFSTQNNGRDTIKSPEDMFESEEIENNLQLVDDAICSYYDIKNNKK